MFSLDGLGLGKCGIFVIVYVGAYIIYLDKILEMKVNLFFIRGLDI